MGNIRRASIFSTLVGRWQQRCGLSLSVLQWLVRPRRARSMDATCCYKCPDTVCVVDSGEPKEPWESISPLRSGQRQFCMGVSGPFKCQKRRNSLMYTLGITTAAADCNAADWPVLRWNFPHELSAPSYAACSHITLGNFVIPLCRPIRTKLSTTSGVLYFYAFTDSYELGIFESTCLRCWPVWCVLLALHWLYALQNTDRQYFNFVFYLRGTNMYCRL